MNFYSNLKISNKLILGFSTVVIMALAIGIFGYFQIFTLERAGNSLFEKGVKPLEHIGDIATDFQRLRVNFREFIIAEDQSSHEYYHGRIALYRTAIDASVKKLSVTLPDAESKKLFARLVQTRTDFTPHVERIIKLTQPKEHDEALAYLRSAAVETAEHAEIEAIENLQEYLVASAGKISERNAETASNSAVLLLFSAIGVSLLAAVMTILITRSISNPLERVLGTVRSLQEGSKEKTELVSAIAGGDLDQEVIVSAP